MTPLQTHIDKCLSEIIFNGCKISSAHLKNYFDTAILLAKIEASEEMTKNLFKRPEIIGEHLTEPNEINEQN